MTEKISLMTYKSCQKNDKWSNFQLCFVYTSSSFLTEFLTLLFFKSWKKLVCRKLWPWSSRIDYFENNKQNYLELFILENSSFFACYLPTIFLFYITGTDDQGMNRYVFVQNIFLRVQTSFTVIFTPPFQTF